MPAAKAKALPAPKSKDTLKKIIRHSDIAMALALVAVIVVMIIPIPTFLIDILLACSITISLAILLTALYVEEPLQFSVFPGLLLVVTLFRLSLNVATTRLILGQGYGGQIIQAFGSFVIKGNYVVGLIIFLVLVVINLVVITKGSGRIAEVAARFTLDAMPGKQMAIDADLNQGMIDEREARRRREKISREADFYGAMDGASKFVRGDAVAGLLDYRHQHFRRFCHRHVADEDGLRPGAANVHDSDRRRRFGGADSRADHFSGRRYHRHPRRLRERLRT